MHDIALVIHLKTQPKLRGRAEFLNERITGLLYNGIRSASSAALGAVAARLVGLKEAGVRSAVEQELQAVGLSASTIEQNLALECVQSVPDTPLTGFEVATLVRHGHPSHEIVTLAEAKRTDLVAVGSRGLTGDSRFLLGSVSDGVVRYAPCSVLVVRS